MRIRIDSIVQHIRALDGQALSAQLLSIHNTIVPALESMRHELPNFTRAALDFMRVRSAWLTYQMTVVAEETRSVEITEQHLRLASPAEQRTIVSADHALKAERKARNDADIASLEASCRSCQVIYESLSRAALDEASRLDYNLRMQHARREVARIGRQVDQEAVAYCRRYGQDSLSSCLDDFFQEGDAFFQEGLNCLEVTQQRLQRPTVSSPPTQANASFIIDFLAGISSAKLMIIALLGVVMSLALASVSMPLSLGVFAGVGLFCGAAAIAKQVHLSGTIGCFNESPNV